MMGPRQMAQGSLFYEFNLDALVPQDHLLRSIDRFVDLSGVRAHLAPFYSATGRPSIDPELMMRMLIIGYTHGIRSERRLCEEVRLNLAYRWFCRLDLTDPIPDHSTFSKNRHGRFRDSDLLRKLFEMTVERCMAEGLVGAEGFAVDASVLEANASRYHGVPPEELDWTEQQRQKRAVAEYLATLDAAAAPNPDRKAPKVISPSDPASAWTAKANKRVQFGYGLNYLIDIENAVIVDVEATPARTYDEVAATKTMIDRTEACFDLKPKRLAADTAYGTGQFLGWLVKEKRITPHIPVWEKSDRRDGIFSRSDFIWDKRRGVYICPTGKLLRTSGTIHDGRTLLYRASKRDCDACPLRPKCCTRQEARKLPRDVHEDARDVARRKMATKAFLQSRDERKRVEMRFAHLKTHHGFERLRLRGLSSARDEFHLAAIVQNLKTMALRIIRPPDHAVA